MFPYIGFMSLVALSAGILNTWRRFAVPAATPVLLNLAMIAAVWCARRCFERHGIEPIYALAVGVMLGGVLQLAVQLPALARSASCRASASAPRRRARPSATRACAGRSQMAPALLGVSVAQLSILINTQIASHQGVGAVSWLFYADRLMEFPTSLLGVALGVVLVPQLSAALARDDAAATRACSTGACGSRCCWRCRARWRCSSSPRRWSRRCSSTAQFDAPAVAKTALALRGYGVGLLGLSSSRSWRPASTPARTCARRSGSPSPCWC